MKHFRTMNLRIYSRHVLLLKIHPAIGTDGYCHNDLIILLRA